MKWTPGVVAVAAVVGLALLAGAEASHLKENPQKHKIVYHLNEAGVDKAKFVLNNIENHIKGVGGLQNIEAIELVVHGPALKNFLTATIDPGLKASLERRQTEGLVFGACGNTMKAFNITLEQLPEGAKYLPQGGVVRVMELEEQGYAYIKP